MVHALYQFDFLLLQLRELLINVPDAKHHDNLQGTVFEDTENSQEQSAFAHRQNGHWYLQAYRNCSFGLYITVYISLAVCLSEITASVNVVLYSDCIYFSIHIQHGVYIFTS